MLFSIIVAIILGTLVHSGARKFVRDRLRYVDAVQKGFVPFLAGGAALLAVLPFAALPLIGIGTAVTVGFAVGSGVAAGVRDIKSGVTPNYLSNR